MFHVTVGCTIQLLTWHTRPIDQTHTSSIEKFQKASSVISSIRYQNTSNMSEMVDREFQRRYIKETAPSMRFSKLIMET